MQDMRIVGHDEVCQGSVGEIRYPVVLRVRDAPGPGQRLEDVMFAVEADIQSYFKGPGGVRDPTLGHFPTDGIGEFRQKPVANCEPEPTGPGGAAHPEGGRLRTPDEGRDHDPRVENDQG